MPDRVLSSRQARAAAVATLLGRLEDLVAAYAGLPPAEREARLAEDADRITGEVARHLQVARQQITPVPVQRRPA